MMRRKIIYKALIALMCMALLTGCGGRESEETVEVSIPPYEKTTYPTVTVKKGDLAPILVLEIHPEKKEQIDYKAEGTNLQVEKVYVTEGTAVKKGDMLARFSSEDLEQELEGVREQIEQNNMLITHYKKIGKIDSGQDYSKDIKSIQEDNAVLSLKCNELASKLEAYSIVAKEDGVITFVNDMLYYELKDNAGILFTEECGTDNFTVRVTDDYAFEKDMEFEAVSGIASYKVKLIDITEDADGSRQLVFAPISDMSGFKQSDTATITIEKPVISNVVYVNKNAVFRKNDIQFVYQLDESGFRKAVEVTTGETVDDNMIITSGLSGGEQVTEY